MLICNALVFVASEYLRLSEYQVLRNRVKIIIIMSSCLLGLSQQALKIIIIITNVYGAVIMTKSL